jgi:hypothetical protein
LFPVLGVVPQDMPSVVTHVLDNQEPHDCNASSANGRPENSNEGVEASNTQPTSIINPPDLTAVTPTRPGSSSTLPPLSHPPIQTNTSPSPSLAPGLTLQGDPDLPTEPPTNPARKEDASQRKYMRQGRMIPGTAPTARLVAAPSAPCCILTTGTGIFAQQTGALISPQEHQANSVGTGTHWTAKPKM